MLSGENMLKVLFCGSRSWIDEPRPPEDVERLRQIVYDEVGLWVTDNLHQIIVIEGECRGPDQWAAEGALLAGLPEEQIVRMPADWNRYGKGAGYKRNLEMLDLKPHQVVAFYNGYNGGTHHTVTYARNRNISVLRIDEEGEWHIDPRTQPQ